MSAGLQLFKRSRIIVNWEHSVDGLSDLMLLHCAGECLEVTSAAGRGNPYGYGVADSLENVEARILAGDVAVIGWLYSLMPSYCKSTLNPLIAANMLTLRTTRPRRTI